MSIRKLLCLVLTLMLCCAAALAEDDVQAKLDAANARIAELEAQVEQYKPYYDAQVIIEYDGGAIFRDDVLAEYAYINDMYSQYGISLSSYGLETQFKQQSADALMTGAALKAKAEELGMYDLDDATLAAMTEEAKENLESYVQSVLPSFAVEGLSEEEAREDAVEYLAEMGYTEESMLESLITSYVDEQMYNYIVADVVVTDEDVAAAYDALVTSQQGTLTNDAAFNSARESGQVIAWYPEGYRIVKHVLVMFSEEQYASYRELSAALSDLEAELTAESEEGRGAEEINADIESTQAALDALYAELVPEAQQVIDEFNEGVAFAELIEKYGDDPGMTEEPTKTLGYAVTNAYGTWDPAFVDGAMAIAEVGGISDMVFGMNGIHIIYYESDVEAGAVALESVFEGVKADALEEKQKEAYNALTAEWIAELNPVYHYERIG